MNNKTEKYLPIGTVCILKGAKKRVMITGFAAKTSKTGDKIFDYIGCIYPEGVISSDKNLLFDHDNIDKIFYMGYVDEEQKELMIKLKQYLNSNNIITGNNESNNQNQSNIVEPKQAIEVIQPVTPGVNKMQPTNTDVANMPLQTDIQPSKQESVETPVSMPQSSINVQNNSMEPSVNQPQVSPSPKFDPAVRNDIFNSVPNQ